MSSTEPNRTEPGHTTSSGPSQGSVALVAVTLLLLGALVWGLRPRQPKLAPAPLNPSPAGCETSHAEFMPTNITAVPDLPLDGLPAAARNRALLHMNMEPCSCGCAESIAACRINHRECPGSARLAKAIVVEENENTGSSPAGRH